MTIYDAGWYAAVVAPQSKLYDDGVNRFRYVEQDGQATSIYGYPGITGDKQVVRRELDMKLFIRHRVDAPASGKVWPTRVIPCVDPWEAGSAQVKEAERAERLGICAEYQAADSHALKAFREPYLKAMRAKGATEKYSDIVERLELWTGNPHVHVYRAPGAGAIFFSDGEWGHYHLSYREPSAHGTAMHAIFARAVPLLTALGCKNIHLGGGTTPLPDDSLYKFKSRIGRQDWSVCFEEVP